MKQVRQRFIIEILLRLAKLIGKILYPLNGGKLHREGYKLPLPFLRSGAFTGRILGFFHRHSLLKSGLLCCRNCGFLGAGAGLAASKSSMPRLVVPSIFWLNLSN